MKKIVIVTLKVLSGLTLLGGIIAGIATSTMSMRGMMRYFVEPSFNVTMFLILLIGSLTISAILYAVAVHLETQDEILNEIKKMNFSVREIQDDSDFLDDCEECDEVLEEVDVEMEPTKQEIEEVEITEEK